VSRWRIAIVLAAAWLACTGVATAQPAEDFARRTSAIAARIDSADADTIKQVLAELGTLSVAFVQAAEAAQLAGGRDRNELRTAYAAVATPIERVLRKNEGFMEAGEREIIEADGDLEAFYDSAKYQRAQQLGANARYYLNWLQYYGAGLHDGEKRKELLRQARDGFSSFTSGDPNSELVVESILGRGLCALDLGELKTAAEDLAVVSRSPKASPERKRKAQLSLLEAYVSAGNTAGALRQSDELLAAGDSSEATWIRYMRLRALLDGAKRDGKDAASFRSEAVLLMDRLRRAGGAWEQRITALAQEAFADGDAWKNSAATPFARWELAKLYIRKQDFEGAAPLLAEVIASDDASLAKHKPQARYFRGLAHVKAGDFAAALADLTAAGELADATERAERAYLIFKAQESLAVAAGTEADLEALTASATSFLDGHPQHAAAFEARFRLAELAQQAGEFAQAIEWYGGVKGDPGIELQAAFAIAQCRFELYRLAATAEERSAVLDQVNADLDAFVALDARVPAKDRAALDAEAVGAKAAVMRAVARKLAQPVDHAGIVAALAEFEERYPSHAELLPQVARMRLEAWRETGEFALAAAEAERHGEVLITALGGAAIEDLAVGFVRAGARLASPDDKQASDAAQRVAAVLYERLVASEDAGARTKLTLARLRENAGALEEAVALYSEVLADSAVSTTALRGLARIAEAQNRYDDALGYWKRLGEAVKPGDLPWYESRYEQARVEDHRGDGAAACKILEALRPAMPGLLDDDLRSKLTTLYDRICG